MLDQEKWIGSQHIMGRLIEAGFIKFNDSDIEVGFKTIMKIMEDYATIPEADEWMNTGIQLGNPYWQSGDLAKENFLTKWGIQKKDKDGKWYVFVQRKNMTQFVKEMKKREDSYKEMIQIQQEKNNG